MRVLTSKLQALKPFCFPRGKQSQLLVHSNIGTLCSRPIHPSSIPSSRRLYSAQWDPTRLVEPPPSRGIWTQARASTLFSILLLFGVSATAFGLFDFYNSFAIWPEEIRADLRAGVKAKHQGDLQMSEGFLRRAYKNSLLLSPDSLAPEPHLKLSGITIILAEVLEAANKPREAYEVLIDALQGIRDASVQPTTANSSSANPSNPSLPNEPGPLPMPKPTPRERMRAVAIASKLGEMAETFQQPAAEEERLLRFAVEEMLRVVRSIQPSKDTSSPLSVLTRLVVGEPNTTDSAKTEQDDAKIVLTDLKLPGWVTVTDVGAPIEALGAFYARVGQIDYAMPLYLQAISLLIPPSPQVSSSEDRCRGAQLMSNLADLILRSETASDTVAPISSTAAPPVPSAAKLHQAEAWAKQALGILEKTRGAAAGRPPNTETPICELALASTLFNHGIIHEMKGETGAAKKLFDLALQQARAVKAREGIMEAKMALRRLERVERVQGVSSSNVAKAS